MSDMSREFEYISKMEEIFDEITAAQDSLKRTIDSGAIYLPAHTVTKSPPKVAGIFVSLTE